MRSTGSAGSMDITAGKLLVNGDVREVVQGYIDTWIEGDQKVVQLEGIISDDEPTMLVWSVFSAWPT